MLTGESVDQTSWKNYEGTNPTRDLSSLAVTPARHREQEGNCVASFYMISRPMVLE
jgi:hypothetical protein